jgi:protein ImuA
MQVFLVISASNDRRRARRLCEKHRLAAGLAACFYAKARDVMAGKNLQLGFDWGQSDWGQDLEQASVAVMPAKANGMNQQVSRSRQKTAARLQLPLFALTPPAPAASARSCSAAAPCSTEARAPADLAATPDSFAASVAVSLQTRAALVRTLQQQIVRTEAGGQIDSAPQTTGVAVLDRLLPARGVTRGTMVEWLAMLPGGAASYLSLAVASETLRNDDRGGVLLVIDRRGAFYPPAAISLGIPAERLVVVKPSRDADALWAIDQGLRCSAVTVVWSELDKLDSRAARRLQLAAEEQNGLGFFVRPSTAVKEPTWADIRWKVQPLAAAQGGRQLQVELLRCYGGRAGATALLEIEDGTGRLREIVATRRSDTIAAVNLAAELALTRKKAAQVQKKIG